MFYSFCKGEISEHDILGKFYAKKNGGFNLCTFILVSHINRRFNFIVPIIIHFSDSSKFLSSFITPFSGVI